MAIRRVACMVTAKSLHVTVALFATYAVPAGIAGQLGAGDLDGLHRQARQTLQTWATFLRCQFEALYLRSTKIGPKAGPPLVSAHGEADMDWLLQEAVRTREADAASEAHVRAILIIPPRRHILFTLECHSTSVLGCRHWRL